MVTEIDYNDVVDAVYRKFEDQGRRIEGNSDDISINKRARTVDLSRRTGSGLFSDNYEAVLTAHPETTYGEGEQPFYCISTYHEDYKHTGRQIAEELEEEFDINMHVFHK